MHKIIGIIALAMTLFSVEASPLIGAHRGASKSKLENTRAAIQLAYQQGADIVECDIRLTADKKLAVIHDVNTAKIAKRSLQAAKSTMAQLQELELKDGQSRICELSEILPLIPEGKILNIEIKSNEAELVPILKQTLQKHNVPVEKIWISSFSHAQLRIAKTELKPYKRLLINGLRRNKVTKKLYPTVPEMIQYARELEVQGISIHWRLAERPEYHKAIADAKLEIHVWVIDVPSRTDKFISLKVDSITTNTPDVIIKYLRKK